MRYIIIFLIINNAISSLYASGLIEACFKDNNTAKTALKDVQFLKVPQDNFKINGNCINISTDPLRVDLYKKYLYRSYQVKLYDFAETISKNECHLIIRKVINLNNQNNSAGVKHQKAALIQKNSIRTSEQKTKMVLMEGLTGSFDYNGSKYQIKCSKTGKGYNIEISANSPNLSFNTRRYIETGKEIELGEIISHAAGEEKDINLNNGVMINEQKKQESYKVFLKVEK